MLATPVSINHPRIGLDLVANRLCTRRQFLPDEPERTLLSMPVQAELGGTSERAVWVSVLQTTRFALSPVGAH